MRPAASTWDWVVVLLLLLAASATSVAAEAPKFDGRGWTVGHQQKNARQTLTEYTLPGQTVENWKELVTSSVFPQPVPIAPFVEKLRSSLSQGCPSLVWNTIRQDERTAVFEWWDAGCGGYPPTYEMDRVTIEQDGLFRLAYAVKVNGPLAPERRKEWLAILGQIPLAERSPGGATQAGTPAASAPDSSAAPPLRKLSAEELAAGVRRSGWPCAAGVKSAVKGQIQGPQGLLTAWVLDCSDGQQYTVLVDPRGSMTSFPTPK
jgi:hypothetical protein